MPKAENKNLWIKIFSTGNPAEQSAFPATPHEIIIFPRICQ